MALAPGNQPLPAAPAPAVAAAPVATTPQTGFVGSGNPYSPAELNGPTGTRPANLPVNYVFDPTANGGAGGWTPGNPARGAPPATSANTQYAAAGSGNPYNTFDASGKGTGQFDPKTGKALAPYSPGGQQYDPITTLIGQGLSKAGTAAKSDIQSLADSLDPSQSADAQTSRDFGGQLRAAATGFQPNAAPQLDTTKLNQDQALQRGNIEQEQRIANGVAPTAADALLQQGTDQAAKNAAGLAAQYSAQNPGMALRQGLAASNNAYATAAAPAAQLKSQEQQTALGAIQAGGATLANQDTTAAGANQTAAVNTNAQNNQQQLGLDTAAANQTNAPLNTDIAGAQAKAQLYGAGTSGIGTLATSLFSDKRVKKNIKRKSLADAMADNVHGVRFEYKPGMADEGKHVGVLAQELEKAMPNAIKPDERGMKRVDTGHVALASAGLLAELTRRIKKLEKRA